MRANEGVGLTSRVAGFLHRHSLWLMVAVYVLAGLAPESGLCLRSVHLGGLSLGGHTTPLSLPPLLLALLLLNAGLGVEPARLRGLLRSPWLLVTGLLANLAVPLGFLFAASLSLSLWHNPAEVQAILVGLALVGAMPVAGSSTAWTQNTEGDLALSLGLVLGSTLLSPLATPAVLHAAGWVTTGEYADALSQLAGGGTSSFLAVFVLTPSLLGVLLRWAFDRQVRRLKPALKVASSVALLLLCYMNAAVALPQTFAKPDWDFLGITLAIVTALCVAGFTAGVLLARGFRADAGRRSALMFGLGMTNNGTGLVLATTALAGRPEVMLPVLFYNLVQHVVAGLFVNFRRPLRADGRGAMADKEKLIPASSAV